MVTAAICAVIAGYRSYTAIGEWVADLPAETAAALGIEVFRLPLAGDDKGATLEGPALDANQDLFGVKQDAARL